MQALPHRYQVEASAQTAGEVVITTAGASAIETQAPVEFGGPPGYWSPETLLVGAVADCYVLSFRAVARASRLEWDRMTVAVEGVLERVEGVTRFTRFRLAPRLHIRNPDESAKAEAALDKAHRLCLVTNSLRAECMLDPEVLAATELVE